MFKLYIAKLDRELDVPTLDEAGDRTRAYVWEMGLKQSLGDAAAGKTGADAEKAVARRLTQLVSNEPPKGSGGRAASEMGREIVASPAFGAVKAAVAEGLGIEKVTASNLAKAYDADEAAFGEVVGKALAVRAKGRKATKADAEKAWGLVHAKATARIEARRATDAAEVDELTELLS